MHSSLPIGPFHGYIKDDPAEFAEIAKIVEGATRLALAPSAHASDLSIERDVIGMECDADPIGLSRRLMLWRPSLGMRMRCLACKGRRVRHHCNNHDRNQRSHVKPLHKPNQVSLTGTI